MFYSKLRPKILFGECFVNKDWKSAEKIKVFFDRCTVLTTLVPRYTLGQWTCSRAVIKIVYAG